MSKRFYKAIIELWWKVEHLKPERIASIGYRNRKSWERRYVSKFNENIYGEKL